MFTLADKFRIVATVFFVASIILSLTFGPGIPIVCSIWGIGAGFWFSSWFVPKVDSRKRT